MPSMVNALSSLLSSPGRRSMVLARGLTLGYTPAGYDNAEFHRLTIARFGKRPSNQELAVMRGALLETLKKLGRGIDGDLRLDTDLYNGRYVFHVFTWAEYSQVDLFGGSI